MAWESSWRFALWEVAVDTSTVLILFQPLGLYLIAFDLHTAQAPDINLEYFANIGKAEYCVIGAICTGPIDQSVSV